MYCGHVKHLFLLQGIFPACYIHLKEAAVEGSGFVLHVYSERPSSTLISSFLFSRIHRIVVTVGPILVYLCFQLFQVQDYFVNYLI